MYSSDDQKAKEIVDESQIPSIKKLDDATINKIAAGEIVVSPSAALKEMIENSIDAGSTQVNILCQKSGFDFLQISDDGCGIKKQDFPLLCERFATSKITNFSDLRKVSSFGFRGEALASISFVSKVTVTSKIKNSELAYTADFCNGLMINDDGQSPRPIAGQQGTTIQVKDMFYNNPQRKKSIGVNEEYSKIIEVVTRYAVHYPYIKFSCRKMDDKKTDVSTHNIPRPQENKNQEYYKAANQIRIDIIKKTYGQNAAGKEFIDFSEFNDLFLYQISGILSKPNTVQSKKPHFLLFINSNDHLNNMFIDRLVESEKLRRAVDQAYQLFQPKGGYSFFVYLSINIPPEQIDVNVHPTKKNVIFERQEEFCEFLKEMIEDKLKLTSDERHFQIDNPPNQRRSFRQNDTQMPYVHTREQSDHHKKNINAMRLVRTDSSAMTLDRFLVQGNLSNNSRINQQLATVVPMNIMSVLKLINEFENDVDSDLQSHFKNHTFVGTLTPEQVLLQFGVELVLVQVEPLLQEFLYQQILRQIQRMDKYKLFNQLSISELLQIALDCPEAQYNPKIHLAKEEMVEFYKNKLVDKADILNEYFSIEIDKETGCLIALPIIYEVVKPYPEELPMFMLRLACDVDYSSQNKYFHQVAEELSFYYAKLVQLFQIHNQNENKNQQRQREEELKWQYQNKLFPFMKQNLQIRRKFSNLSDMTFSLITKVENLYKVFERC